VLGERALDQRDRSDRRPASSRDHRALSDGQTACGCARSGFPFLDFTSDPALLAGIDVVERAKSSLGVLEGFQACRFGLGQVASPSEAGDAEHDRRLVTRSGLDVDLDSAHAGLDREPKISSGTNRVELRPRDHQLVERLFFTAGANARDRD
jgi:hypothetical protein